MGKRRRRKIPVCLMKGDRVPRNYFIIPNAIFEKDLSMEALVTLMYLLLHREAEVPMEGLCQVLDRTEQRVEKYLRQLQEKGIAYPYQSLKVDRRYFMLPRVIFDLGLSVGALATYAYLMKCEDRETYQCWPSHTTIGENIGRSRGSVIGYVRELVEKQLIYTEPTQVRGKNGMLRNGNLRYTIRNIEDAKQYNFEQQVLENEKRAAEGKAACA